MAKRTTTIKYEEAVHQLEEIVHKMENDELDIDSLTDQLEKAKKLIKLCKDKLMKTDDEIHQILDKDES
ncbi:MAG: exodeoxyribonuclease VII small subunit [Prevotella sp.]|jgi:exodeoxyribonuclease VII small subunit|nr:MULTISPECIES: exodeoxyribonuclease VII small subunit [unclassified Prevotella]MCH3970138.1 exodeoxyribonuclease VII small subunit [Prevotella sp.]MCH3984864.1 exodeoxyribonuclease VII small subunit [Prevotella sp.]MCH3992510.1 exodeoxyribonuclease VII small subunit [Prevotella sp.]MCH4016902.1 exodeoxyribonuclease VII small subunit [Prevotella sp.]MCH4099058.1 exodeoxyribonuclease VII small subunit [Prevotella sp.]